jgi:hypothetical protein
MLKHEHASDVAPMSYTPVDVLPAMPQEAKAVTAQELARAIVAVEDRQGVSLQSVPGDEVIQQAIAQSGAAVTPDQLLAEVHRQRGQSHQNAVMTPHLTQYLSVRLLIGGLVVSAAIALLFLVFSLALANKMSAMSESLAKYQEQAAVKSSAPSASQRLQSWKYQGAMSLGDSQSNNLAITTLTTHDEYSKVWKFYAQQSGFSQSQLGGNPLFSKQDGTQSLGASGNATQNGQTVQYAIHSNPTPNDQFATFTQSSPLHNVTAILIHHVGDPVTTVRLISSTSP